MTTTAPKRRVLVTINRIQAAASTRSLFRYERDDAAPGNLTRVRINAAHQAAHPVHPFIFGNFIEHLGGVIYDGIWAQELLNPNLERIETRNAAPPAWDLHGPAQWREEGYLSARSARLPPSTPVSAPRAADFRQRSALSQSITPPTHRIRRYAGTLFARAPEGKGALTVAVYREQKRITDAPLATVRLEVRAADWQRLRFDFTLPEPQKRGETLRFALENRDHAPIDVDQIEVFPEDHLHGVDPDVMERAREWRIPLLRYPGGNFVSGYHWQEGVGPREGRPTRRNPAWGGIEPNHFGTDEFLRFCRALGAEPQIAINAGNGTPEEAAAWVRYCNDDPAESEWGRLRAANGFPRPYNARLWEVGNELYGGWQIGHTDPAGNAARYVRFRDALLKADPTLTLIATGKADEFTPQGMARNREWNEKLLRAAVANGGKAPDYLSIHPLVPLPGYTGRISYTEQYESAMAHPAYLADTLFPDLACLIESVLGPNAPTKIAPTEWGIIVGGDRWWEGPNHDVQAGAVYNALALNAMLKHSDTVTLANMTAFMHGGGIKKPEGVVIVDPQYYTQQMYARACPHTPVETRTSGPGRDVPARGRMPAVENVPDVDIFAALTKDARALVVFAVNRHLKESRPLALEVEGFRAASVSGTILTAPDPQARNAIEAPDAVKPRPFPTPAWPAAAAGWNVTLPPHSLVVLTLKRR